MEAEKKRIAEEEMRNRLEKEAFKNKLK